LWDAADLLLDQLDLANRIPTAEQLDWLDAMTKFAWRYFAGNLKKASYCLKDVTNWQLWCKLKDAYRHVPYQDMLEEKDGTNMQAEPACAGGQCMLQY
jgi:hypothetical protein